MFLSSGRTPRQKQKPPPLTESHKRESRQMQKAGACALLFCIWRLPRADLTSKFVLLLRYAIPVVCFAQQNGVAYVHSSGNHQGIGFNLDVAQIRPSSSQIAALLSRHDTAHKSVRSPQGRAVGPLSALRCEKT